MVEHAEESNIFQVDHPEQFPHNALNDYQTAEVVENKAKVDVENTMEKLRVLGGSVDHPAAIVDIVAPVSGVITDQQVTNAAGVAGLGSPNPFNDFRPEPRLDSLRCF